jgi:serine/threonine protein kinase
MPTEGDTITPSIRLVRELGAGGMGSVWLADHLSLQTQVVVKFMHPQLVADQESLLRFSREAAAGANVKSPHVVQVHDHGIAPDGTPFIVMELLEGSDLSSHLTDNGPMRLADIEQVISQTCKALGRAHERGIVHRDIKPQNIFLTNLGGGDIFVKVLDFGIAKASDLQNSIGTTTKTGTMMGTPYYMSPEQIVGAKTVDPRTDLWALGVVAFECLAGRKPFDGDTLGGLALTICSAPMPVPSVYHPGLPAEVDRWFLRACARELSQRFTSAAEMADALRAAVAGRSTEVATPMERTSVEPSPFAMTNPQRASQTPTPFVAPSFAEPTAPLGSTTRAPVSDDIVSAPPARKSGKPRSFVGVAAAVGLLVVGVVVIYSRAGSPPSTATASAASPPVSASPPSPVLPMAPPSGASSLPPPVTIASVTPSASAVTPPVPSIPATPDLPAPRHRKTATGSASAPVPQTARPATAPDPNSIY